MHCINLFARSNLTVVFHSLLSWCVTRKSNLITYIVQLLLNKAIIIRNSFWRLRFSDFGHFSLFSCPFLQD